MWFGMAAHLLSILGFLIYSVANVLLADLTQFLLDSLGEASQISMGFVGGGALVLAAGDRGLSSTRVSLYPRGSRLCADSRQRLFLR